MTVLKSALQKHLDGGGVIVGEAVGHHGVTRGLSPGNGRLIATPLSESSTVGLAVGLALGGARVVVELVDPAGLNRASEALREAATLSSRGDGVWPVRLVVLVPETTSVEGVGARVLVAAAAADLPGLLEESQKVGPTVLMVGASLDEQLPGTPGTDPVERRAGGAVTLLTSGSGLTLSQAAAAQVPGEAVQIVELRELPPTPAQIVTLGAAVRRTGRVVVLGEAPWLPAVVQAAFLSLESPPETVGRSVTAEALAERLSASIQY